MNCRRVSYGSSIGRGHKSCKVCPTYPISNPPNLPTNPFLQIGSRNLTWCPNWLGAEPRVTGLGGESIWSGDTLGCAQSFCRVGKTICSRPYPELICTTKRRTRHRGGNWKGDLPARSRFLRAAVRSTSSFQKPVHFCFGILDCFFFLANWRATMISSGQSLFCLNYKYSQSKIELRHLPVKPYGGLLTLGAPHAVSDPGKKI